MNLRKLITRKTSLLFGLLFFCANLIVANSFAKTYPGEVVCNVNITSANGGVTITGLTSNANTKLFNSSIQAVWSCNPWQGNVCTGNETIPGLTTGATYFLSVQSPDCDEWIPIVVQGSGGCSDADNDGTCDADDCQPNNPNLPASPGTSCNDFDSNTTNDQIQSDGCTCSGTPVGGGCNVSVSSGSNSITISGLTSDANTKVFNSSVSNVVFSCNPWQGNPCTGTETVSGLSAGQTYFVSVQSGSCNEWIPVTVGGGGNGIDLVTSAPNVQQSPTGTFISYSFELTNQGNTDVTGSFFIRGYISTDATISGDDFAQEIGNATQTGNTPAGSSMGFSGGIVIPNNFPAGNYFLILRVDDTNMVAETNENNNIKATAFNFGGFISGPDLRPTSFSADPATTGEVSGFSFFLGNEGDQTANGSYTIQTYISTDGFLSGNDIAEGTIVTGNTPVGSSQVNGAITAPNVPSGNYFLILVVDDGNTIAESNENNNIVITQFEIFNPGGGGGGICDNVSNVAQGKPTTQSSTITAGGVTGNSSKAVDGNTNGNFFSGSVAATTNQNQAWWQVDLGGFFQVESIEVFNRTEGSARLNDFYILTADLPFTSGLLSTARTLANNEQYYSGQAGTPTTWNFPNGDLVRYVRIQRAGNGHVTLAEVRVNGCPPGGMPENTSYEFTSENEVMTPFEVTKLFPNPTSGELFTQIESSTDGEMNLQIVNVLGQIRYHKTIQLEAGNNNIELNLENLSNGIYHITFDDGEDRTTRQFVVAK